MIHQTLSNSIGATEVPLFEAERRSGFHNSIMFLRSGGEGTLGALLESHAALRNRSRDLIDLGSVYVNQIRETDPERAVKEGDLLRVHQSPRRYSVGLSEESIFFENEDFLVLNKPPNLPTHATVDNLKENALCILRKIRREIYVLNRLDLETRGLLVFAKTKSFQKEFQILLQRRQLFKKYRARVDGKWITPEGGSLLTHHMVKSFRSPKVISAIPKVDTQMCQLEVLDFSYNSNHHFSDLKIRLITGRSHQIRAQLAFEGYPLRGDTAYGSQNPYPFDLVCEELSWVDPRGRTHHFCINSTNTLNSY